MGEYVLMHYGVKGMKWGHRMAQRRTERADRNIRAIERDRSINKINKDYKINELKIQKAKKKTFLPGIRNAMLDNKMRTISKQYGSGEKINNYSIAKNKAYKDPSYKKTPEYNRAVTEGRKEIGKLYLAAIGIGVLSGVTQNMLNR